MDRNDLLCYNTRNKSEWIPLVITRYAQLQGIPKAIHFTYKAVKKSALFMDGARLPQGYRATMRRQFTSCKSKTKKSNVALSQK